MIQMYKVIYVIYKGDKYMNHKILEPEGGVSFLHKSL